MNIKTNYQEKRNEEKNGIELYFETIPTPEEREELKKNGYKWSSFNKCWYKSLGAIQPEPKKETTLKSIKKVEDFQEFLDIYRSQHKYCYYGNKPITNEKFKELEEKDNVAAFKRYSIYKFEDGYYFIIDTKTGIDSTIYYDDEMETPEITENYFIHYNIKNFQFDFEDWKKELQGLKEKGCCSGRVEMHPFINLNYGEKSKEVYTVFWECFGNSRRDKTTVRDLTEDEISDILTISEAERENYIERLKNYFKKYRKNITTFGYWANR